MRHAISAQPGSIEVDALSSLLRSELSACEAYRTAVHAVERDSDCRALSLRYLYRGHRRFADELRELIRGLGPCSAVPVVDPGVWTEVDERIGSRPGSLSESATLRALRYGERESLALVRDALRNLQGTPANFVRGSLVEGTTAAIGLLEALEVSVADVEATERPAIA